MASIGRVGSTSTDLYPPSQRSILKRQGIVYLDRIEWVVRAFALCAIISLVASIALLALAQGEYVSAVYSLYTVGGFIGSFLVLKAIDCCQQAVAKKFHIDLQDDYYAAKQPPPPKKKKEVRESDEER